MTRPQLLQRGVLAAAVVAGLALPALAAAQDTAAAARTTSAIERRVRDAVRSAFRVLPVQNGIVLVPLGRYEGVDNIELRNGTIAINGRVVTGSEVRQRLGRDADVVLELSYFDLSTQQRLLLPSSAEEAPEARQAAPVPEAPAAPAPPEEPQRPFRREVQGRVRVGGDITVDEDELVNGPVVAVGGAVEINGKVRDDVVAIGGRVRLGPRAEVNGDVTVVGGSFRRDAGAKVLGRVNEIDFRMPPIRVEPFRDFNVRFVPWFGDGAWRTFRLLGTLLRIAFVGLLATLFVLVAPRAAERIDVAIRNEPWKAAAIGIFAQLLFIPILVLTIVLLAVSIVGIPLLLLVPFAVLAFFGALVLGFAGSAVGLARAAGNRLGWSKLTLFGLLVVGLSLIWGVTVVGRVVGLGGGPLSLVGGMLLFVGFLIEYAAWTLGLGGALMTRLGRRGDLPTTVPPPLPPPPAVEEPFVGGV
jgi:hypothetical protein